MECGEDSLHDDPRVGSYAPSLAAGKSYVLQDSEDVLSSVRIEACSVDEGSSDSCFEEASHIVFHVLLFLNKVVVHLPEGEDMSVFHVVKSPLLSDKVGGGVLFVLGEGGTFD